MGADLKRQNRWAELIREQAQSGLSVTAFCRKHGVSDQSLYNWRRKLGADEPVRFTLVESNGSAKTEAVPVELVLISGERLLIPPGTDPATLRSLLSVLRERA